MDNINSIARVPAEKFNTIQLLRFIAFFIVIVCHATYYTADRLVKGFYQYESGFNGVVLFFVISGFVMIVSSEKLAKREDGWRVFTMRRLIRIVPIYWLLTTYKLVLMFFASGLVHHAHPDLGTVIKSYLFIPSLNMDGVMFPILGVGWTLNMEMFFYLLFALALAIRVRPVVFLSLVFIPLFVLSFYARESWPVWRFYTAPIVINFLLGVIAAKLILGNIRLSENTGLFTLVAGLLVLIMPNEYIMPLVNQSQLVYQLIMFIASFFIVYSAASIENHLSFSIPGWMVSLGGASYSLYLIHPLIAPLVPTVLKMLKMPFALLSVLGAISIAIAGGFFFYRFCETPVTDFFIRHARRLNLI